jgi:hypothetical protein
MIYSGRKFFVDSALGQKGTPLMEEFSRFIPLLIPLFLLQLVLTVAALVDIIRNKRTRGPEWVWMLIVIFISTIGPIIYFVAGREENGS